jgi:hypothetical protein
VNTTTIRRWHSYIGLFIAPSVLFFALTGAVQLYSLHEAHGGYHPPATLEKLSSVHKDQVFAPSHHHAAPPPDSGSQGSDRSTAAAPVAADEDDDKVGPSTLALKAFFLVVALSLVLSSAFGLWMGLTQTRPRRLAWLLVLAGTLIPVALLLF